MFRVKGSKIILLFIHSFIHSFNKSALFARLLVSSLICTSFVNNFYLFIFVVWAETSWRFVISSLCFSYNQSFFSFPWLFLLLFLLSFSRLLILLPPFSAVRFHFFICIFCFFFPFQRVVTPLYFFVFSARNIFFFYLRIRSFFKYLFSHFYS